MTTVDEETIRKIREELGPSLDQIGSSLKDCWDRSHVLMNQTHVRVSVPGYMRLRRETRNMRELSYPEDTFYEELFFRFNDFIVKIIPDASIQPGDWGVFRENNKMWAGDFGWIDMGKVDDSWKLTSPTESTFLEELKTL